MVLVDTSVWVDHFRTGNIGLANLLNERDVACHLFIVGELACGNLSNRTEILSLMGALPLVTHAEHEELENLGSGLVSCRRRVSTICSSGEPTELIVICKIILD